MHALIENGAVKQYPYGLAQLKKARKNVGFPKSPSDEVLASFDVLRVFNETPPKSDKDVAEMQQRLVVMQAEIAALQAKQRTPEEEERLQSIVASHAVETQILQDLPAPYVSKSSVLEEKLPFFDAGAQRWTQSWSVRNLTEEELSGRNAAQAAQVRAERNKLIAECDWTQVADSPVDKEVWATYRQALRDVPVQEGFPWDVIWPIQPE